MGARNNKTQYHERHGLNCSRERFRLKSDLHTHHSLEQERPKGERDKTDET